MRVASPSRRFTSIALALALATAPAYAQYTIGGHNETSEPMPPAFVLVAPPNPGLCAPGGGMHLLISEVCVTPTSSEFIEICNPTPLPIDLTDYYLTDDWFAGPPANGYFLFPQAGYVTAVNSDFIVRFPPGYVIPPGGVLPIAVDGAGFIAGFGFPAALEILGTDPGTPDMQLVSGNAPVGPALLTNTSEVVALFFWDRRSDVVCDVDICQWGTLASGNAIDKTGLACEGPDADAVPTAYLPDTPRALQSFAPAPPGGSSLFRQNCVEQPEVPLVGGNGCIPGGPTPAREGTWGRIKILYR
jgi:hypothetical protein